QPVDLTGCHLTDDPTTNKFTFGPGVTLGPREFLSLVQTQLNFALHAAGETVYLINSNGTRVLDVVRFAGQPRDVAFGGTPDGSPWWRRLVSRTPGAPNSAAASPVIVINETLYAPLSGGDDDQFVELYNASAGQVDLSGWRFVDGIDFTFPPGIMLA